MQKKITVLVLYLLLQTFLASNASEISTYNVNLNKIGQKKVIKKGSVFDLTINSDYDSKEDTITTPLSLTAYADSGESLPVTGGAIAYSSGERFSMHGRLQLGTNKIILPNGQESYFFTNSTILEAHHPPHANTRLERMARIATRIAAGASPATLGISFGASFLIGGLLSARINGWDDFIWGGFDGAGLPMVESLLREQPDVILHAGATIPFELTNDIEIDEAVQKDKTTKLDMPETIAIEKINKLISWGDLAGAIELANKTGQKEKLKELLELVSN